LVRPVEPVEVQTTKFNWKAFGNLIKQPGRLHAAGFTRLKVSTEKQIAIGPTFTS
jgi:hypothetical protein